MLSVHGDPTQKLEVFEIGGGARIYFLRLLNFFFQPKNLSLSLSLFILLFLFPGWIDEWIVCE